jgi:pyruvate carboxylase
VTATNEDGDVKVFFELNGQPRTVKVPDRSFAGEGSSRRKADESNETHVAAPMPGTISSLQVRTGNLVKAGETLLTLEAMKMETALRAPRDGTIGEVYVKVGDTVDAWDLIAIIESQN